MPFVVLFVFFALIFGPTLAAGKIVLVGDPLREFYPLRTVAWQMIRDGHLPTWMPNILSGYPLSSMVMLGLGYPLTWAYLVLPGHWAEQLYVIAPYALAPLFTYLFLREQARSPAASILGALTFGYGGFLFSPIGLTGVHANSALWMPLVLLGVARSRRRPLGESLLIATAAYTLSMLAGSGQIFLYAGALALGYALFLTIVPSALDGETPRRWQPLAVATGAIAVSVGLTAFQTLQTWTTVGLSIRDAYPAGRIQEGSFTPGLAWRSLLQPLGNYWDSSTFVPLTALLLAIVALAMAGRRNSDVRFWSFVAAVSWLLILGNHSPLFNLYVHLPFVGLFRFPSRHSMEWTFAVAVLAAYGWDIVDEWIGGRSASPSGARRHTMILTGSAAAVALLAAFMAVRWRRHTIEAGLDQIADLGVSITRIDAGYLAWKLAFTLAMTIALVLAWRLQQGRLRSTLLALFAAFCCFVEPTIWLGGPVVAGWSPSRSLFGTRAAATQFLLQQHAERQRTFSMPHPYALDFEPVRDVDAVNWTALAGLEDANGYESLILSRYSLAFHGYGDTEPFVNLDPQVMGLDSHVLDLLNVGHVIAFDPLSAVRPETIERDGIVFTASDFGVDVKSDRPYTLSAGGDEVDSIALVTTLGAGGFAEQGAPVARISIHGADGRIVQKDLLAGIHTSELAFDSPAAKGRIRHRLAPVFDSSPGDAFNTFQTHRYMAKIDLGTSIPATRVEFLKTTSDAGVGLWKVSLHQTHGGRWLMLPQAPPERWRRVYDRNGVVIFKNLRVLPRAWLVRKVGMLDHPEILRMIRGESEIPFDPRTEALVETTSGSRTVDAAREFAQNGGDAPLTPADHVTILRREPDRLSFETVSAHPAMLVVSEIDHPGWRAKVDGVYEPVHRTDYLLRGVFVPSGRHRVEMAYRPHAARKGGFVSLATLSIFGILLRSRWVRRL